MLDNKKSLKVRVNKTKIIKMKKETFALKHIQLCRLFHSFYLTELTPYIISHPNDFHLRHQLPPFTAFTRDKFIYIIFLAERNISFHIWFRTHIHSFIRFLYPHPLPCLSPPSTITLLLTLFSDVDELS